MIKTILVFGMAASLLAAADGVDIYSAKDLAEKKDQLSAKHAPFSSENLQRYGNHYTMLAHRDATGSAEVHEHEADIFVIEDGAGTLVTGGTLVNQRTEKTGELRGSGISGGERHEFGTGDVIHIPAGIPHQILLDKGKPVTYFVVKVTGQ